MYTFVQISCYHSCYSLKNKSNSLETHVGWKIHFIRGYKRTSSAFSCGRTQHITETPAFQHCPLDKLRSRVSDPLSSSELQGLLAVTLGFFRASEIFGAKSEETLRTYSYRINQAPVSPKPHKLIGPAKPFLDKEVHRPETSCMIRTSVHI